MKVVPSDIKLLISETITEIVNTIDTRQGSFH